eukprot:414119-Prymnesium_polylepis.1
MRVAHAAAVRCRAACPPARCKYAISTLRIGIAIAVCDNDAAICSEACDIRNPVARAAPSGPRRRRARVSSHRQEIMSA